jgi:ATP-dependent Clp protease ATP-binding subunit ClpB
MTSNLGAEHLLAGVTPGGEFMEGTRDQVMDTVRSHFRPEFLNRLNDIVIFTPLTREHLKGIISLQVAQIGERLAERHIALLLTDEASDRVLKEAYDPLYGARPLKRYLERQITNGLSHRIIAGDLIDGSRVILKPGAHTGLELEVEPHTANEPTALRDGVRG